MDKLLEKAINCFSSYLTRLNCGMTQQNYELLYGAVLLLKNNINDTKYIQYFYNNLICSSAIKLTITDAMNRVIGFELSTSEVILPEFVWSETNTPTLGTYTIITDSVPGYNFLYFSIPPGVNVIIYDALGNVLFNSSIPSGGYEFELVGTKETSKGQNNVVYKKKNVYNSTNPIPFTINLF